MSIQRKMNRNRSAAEMDELENPKPNQPKSNAPGLKNLNRIPS